MQTLFLIPFREFADLYGRQRVYRKNEYPTGKHKRRGFSYSTPSFPSPTMVAECICSLVVIASSLMALIISSVLKRTSWKDGINIEINSTLLRKS